VARQLTLIESGLFKCIQPKECLNQAWNNKKLKHLAPNILNISDRFNEVCNWVATEILRETKLRERGKVLRNFIDIAWECFEINAFSIVQEIIAALNMSSIHRLTATWAELKPRTQARFKALEAAMSREKNYLSPRELLEKCSPPCVPYLGIFLSDLTFIEDGMPNDLNEEGFPKPLINFNKRRKVAQVIERIVDYQNVPYKFHIVPEIRDYLVGVGAKGWDQDQQYKESLLREPRKKAG